MRKVIGYRRAWLPFRNAFSASHPQTSSLTASLKSEQCPLFVEFSSLQPQGVQSQSKSSAEALELGLGSLQRRTKCSSEASVPFSASRSVSSSAQSLQVFSRSPASTTGFKQIPSVNIGHVGVAFDFHYASLKLRRNCSSTLVSDFLGGAKDFCTKRCHGESHVRRANGAFSSRTSGATLSKLEREEEQIRSLELATAQKDNVDVSCCDPSTLGAAEECIGLTLTSRTEDGHEEEDLYGRRTGKADGTLQIRSRRRNQTNSRPWNTQRVEDWSLCMQKRAQGFRGHTAGLKLFTNVVCNLAVSTRLYSTDATQQVGSAPKGPEVVDHSQRAVVVALWCNFLVFSLKVGVWFTTSSHVMLAEAVHSLADLANQGLLAYGLMSSRRAPDALHPYGYTKERFVWSLISAVGIFCLGAGATIVHGMQNLWSAEPLGNIGLAAAVIAGSMLIEGASFLVAYGAVKKGAAAEGMTLREYLWRGHDPTSVAVLMEDGAAVAGLVVAGLALATAEITGNPIWDPIGSILVGNLLGVVAIFLIQRNRQALLGRSIDDVEMRRIINLLIADPVVEGLYDCKSEVIGPGAYRFKAEIDFNGVVIVQNYLHRAGRDTWMKEFREAVNHPDGSVLDRVMAEYGEEVVSALGCEVDRLEKDIQRIVPGILHVDIEAHNPNGPTPREKFYLY